VIVPRFNVTTVKYFSPTKLVKMDEKLVGKLTEV
jgi:hypothetical protein